MECTICLIVVQQQKMCYFNEKVDYSNCMCGDCLSKWIYKNINGQYVAKDLWERKQRQNYYTITQGWLSMEEIIENEFKVCRKKKIIKCQGCYKKFCQECIQQGEIQKLDGETYCQPCWFRLI